MKDAMQHPGFNPLDWLLAALLLYSAVRAAMRGFFREACTLAGILIGFPLACWFYRDLAGQLRNLITTPAFAQFAAFLLILAAVTVTASLLGRLFRRGARTLGLGFADRLGGALFGLIRGVLLGTAFLLAVTAFLPTAPWIQTSLLVPYFLRTAHAVSFTMPQDLRLRLRDGLDHLQSLGRLKHSSSDWIKSGLPSHTGVQ
jgi:membrane protein required for colicin V production